MSIVDQNEQKLVPQTGTENKEVWKTLAIWAGDHPTRWRMITVMALLECSDWSQEMVAKSLGVTQGRVAQIVAEARTNLPRAFEPSPRDLAAAA